MDAQLLEVANRSLERVKASPDELKLVDTSTAANILGAQPATLVLWRCTQRYDLPYVKIGRLVLYDLRDLAEFVERRKVRHTEPTMTVERPSWPRRATPKTAHRKNQAGKTKSPSME
jgi:hypothetical protein